VFGSLFAVSDLHTSHAANGRIVDDLRPESSDDWLIVAGDVGDTFADVERVLRLLRQRFAKVIWTPGNHELWTLQQDPVQLRGEARYQALVRMCQNNDVVTPEDEFAVWLGPTGPMTIVPLFQLYDHSWLAPGTKTKKESLEYAHRMGVVCTDEMILHPDPYPGAGCPSIPIRACSRPSGMPLNHAAEQDCPRREGHCTKTDKG
jgi:hypothetical protein